MGGNPTHGFTVEDVPALGASHSLSTLLTAPIEDEGVALGVVVAVQIHECLVG